MLHNLRELLHDSHIAPKEAFAEGRLNEGKSADSPHALSPRIETDQHLQEIGLLRSTWLFVLRSVIAGAICLACIVASTIILALALVCARVDIGGCFPFIFLLAIRLSIVIFFVMHIIAIII